MAEVVKKENIVSSFQDCISKNDFIKHLIEIGEYYLKYHTDKPLILFEILLSAFIDVMEDVEDYASIKDDDIESGEE